MHILWQLKQINTFQGMRHVNSNMTFGSHSAPNIWCTLFCLVIWVAIHILTFPDPLHYMDDAWSYKTDPTLVLYEPYNAYYLHKQVTLLHLYDHLGLPHVKKKQVFSHILK